MSDETKNPTAKSANSDEILDLANPFDPASLTLAGNPADGVGVKKALIHLSVRKPNRQEFVQTHPDDGFRIPMAILDLKTEGEIYAVKPEIAAIIPGETRPVMLTLSINRQGTIFLWPVPLPRQDGRELAWHVTARQAAERAREKWIRVIANMSAGAYDVFEANADVATPEWPEHSLAKLLEIAFGNGRLIDREDHPVLQQLLGQA